MLGLAAFAISISFGRHDDFRTILSHETTRRRLVQFFH
jgi:hypothetical protein